MGIYGLLSVVKKIGGAYEHVSLSEIAVEYRNKTKKGAVLLVDVSCCAPTFATPHLGDPKCLKKNLETFVNNCFEIGIRLIFVGHGLKFLDNYESWKSKYNLQSSTSVRQRNFYFGFILNMIPEILLSVPLIQKCEFVRPLFTSTQYITEYAKTRGCFAILSNNSHFLMVEGAAYFLSITDLDVHSLTTRNFSRNMLAKSLNISPSELLVFGSLMRASEPQMYAPLRHAKLKSQKEILNNPCDIREEIFEAVKLMETFPKAEEIVRDMSLIDALEGVSEEKRLLFKKNFESFTASRPTEGIKPTGFENWDQILRLAEERHVKGVANKKILEILVNRVVFFMPRLFKKRVTAEETLSSLRKNMYGIIFFECPDTNLAVMEYTSSIGVSVSFNKRAHCGLLQLWSKTDSDEILNLKRKVFCQTLSQKLSPEVLEELDLPEERLFPVLAISYWIANIEKKPTDFELKVLLLQMVLARTSTTAEMASLPENSFDDRILDPVDMYLAILEHLSILNSICGEPFCRFKTNVINCFHGEIYGVVYRNLLKNRKGKPSDWEIDPPEEVTVLRRALKKLESVYNSGIRDRKNEARYAVQVVEQNIKKLNI